MNTHALNQTHLYALISGAAFLLMGFIPATAQAATTKPTCELTVTTAGEEAELEEGDMLTKKGESFKIAWTSKNAEDATLNGASVDTTGSTTVAPTKNTTYEFEFTNGKKRVACEVSAHIAEGSVTGVTSGSKPTLSGKASGVRKVDVAVYKEGSTRPLFHKKNLSVRKGMWEAKSTKSLEKGNYEVRVTGGKKYNPGTVATAVLSVGTENSISGLAESKGVLSVTTLPLLTGGNTRAGASVPVAYLQLRNTGTETVKVTGFTVKQNGSAGSSTIENLSTVDDKGGSRGVSLSKPFKDGSAFAPTNTTVAPGGLKLFTIKAQLGSNAAIGSNLKIDVTGVETNGSVKGSFPLKGVTWSVGS